MALRSDDKAQYRPATLMIGVSSKETSFHTDVVSYVGSTSVPTHSFTSRGEACQRLFGPVALESD